MLRAPECEGAAAEACEANGEDAWSVLRPGHGRIKNDPDLNAALMGTSFLAQNAGKRSVTVRSTWDADGPVAVRLCLLPGGGGLRYKRPP